MYLKCTYLIEIFNITQFHPQSCVLCTYWKYFIYYKLTLCNNNTITKCVREQYNRLLQLNAKSDDDVALSDNSCDFLRVALYNDNMVATVCFLQFVQHSPIARPIYNINMLFVHDVILRFHHLYNMCILHII